MNICILTHTFPRNKRDFSAAFMKEFADGMVEAGNKVFVLAPFDVEYNRKNDIFKLVTYKYIWPDSWHKLGYSRAMKADVSLKLVNFVLLPFMLFFGTLTLIRLVRKEKIDIVNVHWILPNGVIALAASLLTDVPYVVTLPGTDAFLAYKNKAFGWVAKVVAQKSSGIVSNSSWHLKRILNLGVRGKKTAIISYPIDVTALKPDKSSVAPLRRKLGISEKNLVVMAIGRLVYKKGFSYLIKAAPAIIKKNPDARVVIGGDGDLRRQLEALAKKLKIERKVLFIGNIPRNEILAYYNLADVFVAPSVVDAQGNVDGGPVVSFESMACGKAQVVTSVLGVAEIIKDGINGYIIKQKDVPALAGAINKLLASKHLRQKMGQANRKLILNEAGTKSIGLKYNEFFEKVR